MRLEVFWQNVQGRGRGKEGKKEKEEGKETREAGGESYSPLSYLQLSAIYLGQLQHKHLNSCIFMVHQFLSLETI